MTYIQKIDKYEKILVAYYDCISNRTRQVLSLQDYSEHIDTLLEMRGDNLIDDEDLSLLLKQKDISPFLEEYCEALKDVELTEDTRKKLLRLCLNTYYDGFPMNRISFDDALHISGKSHIAITDEGYLICDKPLYQMLSQLNVELNIIDNGFVKECTENDLQGYLMDDDEDCNFCIVPTDYMTALAVSEIMSEQYIFDFIEFCNKNNLSVGKRIKEEYNAYVQDAKLTFSLRLYRPYRHICGQYVNVLDYRLQNGFADEIKFDVSFASTAPETIIRDVQSKYIRNVPVANNDVIEVLNDRKTSHYCYRKTDMGYEFERIDKFTVPLVEENKLWDIIRDNQDNIKSDGENIYISAEVTSHLDDKERTVIANILRQQQLNINKQTSNDKKQRLTQILDKARAIKKQGDADKAAAAEAKAAARAARQQNKPVDTDAS